MTASPLKFRIGNVAACGPLGHTGAVQKWTGPGAAGNSVRAPGHQTTQEFEMVEQSVPEIRTPVICLAMGGRSQ